VRFWGPGLFENDVGEALRAEWEELTPRPGDTPLQPYMTTSQRWTKAWKRDGDQGTPHAWLALAVLQASTEFLDDDVTLEALAAIDRDDANVPPELREDRRRVLRHLRELLVGLLNDDGTEEDLRQIARLGFVDRAHGS
jgi:hypothetical protein